MPREDRYGVRTELVGAQRFEEQLNAVGAGGQASLERLSGATGKVNVGLGRLDTTARGTRETLRLFGNQVALIDGPLGGIASRITAVGSSIGRFGIAATAATAAIAATGFAAAGALRQFAASEQSLFRLGGVLRATGNAAGLTKEEIDDLSRSLGDLTLTSANEARDAASALLTFRTIQGNTLERTLKLAQDLSAVFGSALPSAAVQLGKALEDPITGITALNRSGVNFTQTQRELLKSLVETGRLFEAQTLILDRVEQQVGGAGVAEAGGLAGATDSLFEAWDRLLKKFAETTGIASGAISALNKITSALDIFGRQNEQRTTAESDVELLRNFENFADPNINAAIARDLIAAQQRVAANRLEAFREQAIPLRQSALTARNQLAADVESDRASSIQEVIDNLQFELEQLGRSEAAQRTAAQLRKDATQATDEEAAAIARLNEQIVATTDAQKLAEDRQKEIDKAEEKRIEAIRSRGPRALRQLAAEAREIETEERRQAEKLGDLLESLRDQAEGITAAQRDFLDGQEDLQQAFEFFNVPIEEQGRLLAELQERYRETTAEAEAFSKRTIDALAELATTGRFEIRAFIEGLLQDFLRLQLQEQLSPILTAGFTAAQTAVGSFFTPSGQTQTVLQDRTSQPGGIGGFQFGGSFQVPGAGSADSQFVSFRATPGERVTISPPGQGSGNVQIIDQRGAGSPPIQQQQTAGPSGQQTIRLIVRDSFTDLLRDDSLEQPLGAFGVKKRPIRRG